MWTTTVVKFGNESGKTEHMGVLEDAKLRTLSILTLKGFIRA